MRLAALIAFVLLLVPVVALADPVSLIATALIQAGSWYAVAGYALMIGTAVYGADQQRKRAAAEREAQRQAYNAGLKDRTVTRVATDAPHRYVYGRCRVGSDVVAMFSAGARDEYKYLVCVHAAHECDGIEEIYIAGKPLGALDANGDVTGGDYGIVEAVSHIETQTGISFVLAYLPKDLVITRKNPLPYRKPARINVPYTLDGQTVTLSQDFGTVTCNYQYDKVTSSRVRVKIHLGTPADTADAMLMEALPDKWPATAVLRGFCYTVVRLDLNQPEFQGGIPPIEVMLRGKKLYDPRSGLTAWSQNNALAEYDYLTGEMCGVEAADIPVADYIAAANVCDEDIGGMPRYTFNGTVSADQDPQKVIEQIAASMGGGVVGTTWNCWAGKYVAPVMALSQDDIVGAWSVVGGASDAELYNGVRGQYISEETGQVLTDFKPYQNAAYLAADGRELWTNIDFPYTDAVQRVHNLCRIYAEDQRNGFTIKATFSLKAWRLKVGNRVTFTSPFFGQTDKVYRVADRRFGLEQGVELTLKEDAASIWDLADAVLPDETPNTNLPSPFFVPKPVGVYFTSGEAELLEAGDGTLIPRIAVRWQRPSNVAVVRTVIRYRPVVGPDGWSIAPTPDFSPAIEVPVLSDESGAGMVEWINNVQEGYCYEVVLHNENAAGFRSDIVLDNNVWAEYSDVASISAVELSESLSIAAGAVVSKVHVKITANLARYYRIRWWRADPLQFKLIERQFDSEFDLITDAVKGPFNIEVIPARVSLGDIFNASLQLVGKSARPADVTGLTFNVSKGKARLSWDPATDLDVIVGGNLVLSHSPELTGAAATSLSQYEMLPGSSTGKDLPAFCEGTWLAKWMDSSLNPSVNYAAVTVTYSGLPDVRAATAYDCAPGWAGAKVGCMVETGRLTMDGTWVSGNSTIATYRDAVYDFGFVGDVGVKADARFVGYGIGTIGSITEVISLWADFTGDGQTDIAVGLFLRTTDDDPANPAAVWTDFRPIYLAESFRARGMQIELRMQSAVQTKNIYIDALNVEPYWHRLTAAGADVVSAAGATAITYPAPFHEAPVIAIVPQNMATGDYYEVTAKSATGFTVTFKNSAGTAVSRTFDWQANGY